MSHERLEQRLTLERVIRLAQEAIKSREGFIPILIASGKENMAVVEAAQLPESYEPRLQRMRKLGQAFAIDFDIGPLESIYFVTVGWSGMIEAVFISFLDLNSRISNTKIYKVERNTNGEPIQLTDLRTQSSDREQDRNILLEEFANSYGENH